MSAKFVLGIDEGTTSERVVLFDVDKNTIVDAHGEKIAVNYPHSGWVEQNANDIVKSVKKSLNSLIFTHKLKKEDIIGIAITNQRETVVAWDNDGNAVAPAIVWQCRRTAEFCDAISEKQKNENSRNTEVHPGRRMGTH